MTLASGFRFSPRPNRANLIHWREWGQAAFDEAQHDNKLIILVLTAFWCGICQRLDETTLSDDEVLVLLNACFVPIRVEDNERPDVDLRYNRDGWPTVVFLTPDGQTLLSVNALEPEPFIKLLVQLIDLHDNQQLAPQTPVPHNQPDDPAQLSSVTLDRFVHHLGDVADTQHGGFGGPHKYFVAEANDFYLHLFQTTGRSEYLEHVLHTLDTLPQRKIFDTVDGGFFRYSSKPDWNEPHPEKLLLDQAMLLRNYLSAFALTRRTAYSNVADGLMEYLERTLSSRDTPCFSGCQDYVRIDATGRTIATIDEYIYCDANATTASAYFDAWRILARPSCRQRAEDIVEWLWHTLRAPAGGMFHFWNSGFYTPGLLLDSAVMGQALLDGYAVNRQSTYLDRAVQLGQDILRMHMNPDSGFFDIAEPGPAALRVRVTVLSQNATVATFFLTLAELTGDHRYRDAAEWALHSYRGSPEIYGPFSASYAHALALFLDAAVRLPRA